MLYGVPYKGSKSKIAKEIVDFLPPAENFYDLFAGGCAITHAALLSGKYKHVVASDIDDDGIRLFRDAAAGKYHDERRWIGREDFKRLKDTDPYVRYCWSFGNTGEDYMYAPEIERFKKWLHLIFFAETPKEARLYWKKFVREFQLVKDDIDRLTQESEKLCTECGVELLRKPDGTIDAARIKKDVLRVLSADIREYMRDALKASGHTAADVDRLLGTNGMAGHYFGVSQWELPTAEAYEKMREIIPGLTIPWAELREKLDRLESLESLESLERLERLERLQRLESLERLQSLESLESLQSLERLQSLESLESLERLERLQRLESLESRNSDYADVKILPDSVIYCDIPYRGTSGYQKGGFDYNRFYSWACAQTQPIYISEYAMPEQTFECVWERKRTCSMAAKTTKKTAEKLFIPRR